MQKSLFLAGLLGVATLLGAASASAQNTPGTVSGPTSGGVTVTSPAGSSMSQSTKSTTTSSSTHSTTKPVPVRRQGSISRKTTGGATRTTHKSTSVKQ